MSNAATLENLLQPFACRPAIGTVDTALQPVMQQQDGRDDHAALAERLHLHRLVRHEEADFLLQYWSRTATAIDLAETCR